MTQKQLITHRKNLFEKLNKSYGRLLQTKQTNKPASDFITQIDYINATAIVVIDELIDKKSSSYFPFSFYPDRINKIFREVEELNLKS